jgi:hypothetical protein
VPQSRSVPIFENFSTDEAALASIELPGRDSMMEWHPLYERFTDYLDRKNKSPNSLLFCGHPYDYNVLVNDKFFHKILDSLKMLLGAHFDFRTVELSSSLIKLTSPRYRHTEFIRYDSYPLQDNSKALEARGPVIPSHLKYELDYLGELISELAPGTNCAELEDYILAKLIELQVGKLIYLKYLEKFRPCAVFVTRYNGQGPLISACRELGIISVDLQQEFIGTRHDYYSNWTELQNGGYSIFPDYFWVWDAQAAATIEKWSKFTNGEHKVIIGGNPWFILHKKFYGLLPVHSMEEIDQILDHQQLKILVALGLFEDLIPRIVLEAMKLAPPDYIWLLRLHPRDYDRQDAVIQLLMDNNISNFEIKHATALPLYELFSRVDHVISLYSGICAEAPAFSKPTTIIEMDGLKICKNYVEEGLVHHTNDAEGLLSILYSSKINEIEMDQYEGAQFESFEKAVNNIFP